MFPGYVTIFKDSTNLIHLYFFPGVDDNNEYFYRDLDLSKCTGIKYTVNTYSDDSKEYIFEDKRILKIVCKLVDNKNEIHIKELTL